MLDGKNEIYPKVGTEVRFTLRLFDLLIKPIASSPWLGLANMQKNVLEMQATILLKSRREGEGATKATSALVTHRKAFYLILRRERV